MFKSGDVVKLGATKFGNGTVSNDAVVQPVSGKAHFGSMPVGTEAKVVDRDAFDPSMVMLKVKIGTKQYWVAEADCTAK